MAFDNPRSLASKTQYHTKLKSGKVKCVSTAAGAGAALQTATAYSSSYYDVYLKGNNAESDIHLKHVPADPQMSTLAAGQAVLLSYIEWNQKPRIIGHDTFKIPEVVDINPVTVTPIWAQFHQNCLFARAANYEISRADTDNFKLAWTKTVEESA